MSSAQKAADQLREEASRPVMENGYEVLRRTYTVEADGSTPEPPHFKIPFLGLIQIDDLERFPNSGDRLEIKGPHLKDTGPYHDRATGKSEVIVMKYSRKAGKPNAKWRYEIEKRTKG